MYSYLPIESWKHPPCFLIFFFFLTFVWYLHLIIYFYCLYTMGRLAYPLLLLDILEPKYSYIILNLCYSGRNILYDSFNTYIFLIQTIPVLWTNLIYYLSVNFALNLLLIISFFLIISDFFIVEVRTLPLFFLYFTLYYSNNQLLISPCALHKMGFFLKSVLVWID